MKAERLVYSIPETADKLGISKSLAYRLANENILPVLLLGNRRVVPKARLEELVTKGIPINANAIPFQPRPPEKPW